MMVRTRAQPEDTDMANVRQAATGASRQPDRPVDPSSSVTSGSSLPSQGFPLIGRQHTPDRLRQMFGGHMLGLRLLAKLIVLTGQLLNDALQPVTLCFPTR